MRDSKPVVRVLLVDDYEPFRRFVREKLKTRSELEIVGEATDGLEAVEKAEKLHPDLIVLDIGLPKLNGIEAAPRMSKLVPSTTILFLSQNDDPDIVEAALSNGAKGYVLKLNAERELLPAVGAVLRGERFASTGIAELRETPSLD